MTESNTIHGYEPPEREDVECIRCEENEVTVIVDGTEPPLCGECLEELASMSTPQENREITPMDRRWR